MVTAAVSAAVVTSLGCTAAGSLSALLPHEQRANAIVKAAIVAIIFFMSVTSYMYVSVPRGTLSFFFTQL